MTVGAGFLEFLDRLDGRGVVLAVDDAHWADRPSLQALIFALRRLVADRVLAIIAVRDDQAPDLPESLGRLIRKQTGTVLRLRGLDEEDLARARRGDGHRRCQRRWPPVGCGTARRETRCTPGHCSRNSRRPEWGSNEELLPSPRSFRTAGAGPLPIVRRADPPVDRRGRRPRVALPAAGRRRPGCR